MVCLTTLAVDGRPVAAELHLAFRQRRFLLQAAHDPAWDAMAPDQLVRLRMVEDALASGSIGFDFGRGNAQRRRHWGTSERQLVTLTLTRTGVTGRLTARRLRAVRSLDQAVRAGTGTAEVSA
jgi:CelD/BcsL family acetyltransferase involved in cellulose biosynthesis